MHLKKLALICGISLIILGCVVAAGCTSTTTGTPEADVSAGTDYSDMNNWMYFGTNASAPADQIFFYGTAIATPTYESGVGDISDSMKKSAQAQYEIKGAAFEDYTNVYAPYYRQIASDAFSEIESCDAFIDLIETSEVMEDVTAALDCYFENCNNGRPYILAGHSQGGAVLQAILEVYMKEHPEYYKNMIAAYAVGYAINPEWLKENPHVKFAEGEDDTGVIISWNTEGPNATRSSTILCENAPVINPITWKTDESYADKSLSKGAKVSQGDGTYVIVPQKNDAQINATRGVVICTTDTNYIDSDTLSDTSLHNDDYAVYFEDVKANGLKRVQAFLSGNA
ncbi:MAG TPA: DUF3089 domain-containing protein [Methanocorpusculum sp.]|nr:DUF3089 domain-containing protein [Methanocorpusculum sp.]